MSPDGEENSCTLLRELKAYWESRRKSRLFPRRSDIDPVHIPRLLPHIFLADVEREAGLRFRFRLVGTCLEDAVRQWLTGCYVEELKVDGARDEILAQYRLCAERCVPVVSRHRFINEDQRPFDYERLLLPLAVSVDNRVDMILGGICFRAPFPTPSIPFGRS